jgi:hypothetical protein
MPNAEQYRGASEASKGCPQVETTPRGQASRSIPRVEGEPPATPAVEQEAGAGWREVPGEFQGHRCSNNAEEDFDHVRSGMRCDDTMEHTYRVGYFQQPAWRLS